MRMRKCKGSPKWLNQRSGTGHNSWRGHTYVLNTYLEEDIPTPAHSPKGEWRHSVENKRKERHTDGLQHTNGVLVCRTWVQYPALYCDLMWRHPGVTHHMSHMPPFLFTTIVDHPPSPNVTSHPRIRAKMLRYQVSYPLPFMQVHPIP